MGALAVQLTLASCPWEPELRVLGQELAAGLEALGMVRLDDILLVPCKQGAGQPTYPLRLQLTVRRGVVKWYWVRAHGTDFNLILPHWVQPPWRLTRVFSLGPGLDGLCERGLLLLAQAVGRVEELVQLAAAVRALLGRCRFDAEEAGPEPRTRGRVRPGEAEWRCSAVWRG
ncbi:MAG: hypothetical protein K6T75_03925 [Acetobacteraceae bacterium]|nr:hypothetical protein [Acetobacteraceae bacterium]